MQVTETKRLHNKCSIVANFLFDCFNNKKRTKLFNCSAVIPHIKSNNNDQEQTNFNWKSKLSHYSDLKSTKTETMCSEQLFIEPQKWFADDISDVNGKLMCPNGKCGSKLGTYDWCGSKCSCGSWVVPAIHIQSSKVDLCKMLAWK